MKESLIKYLSGLLDADGSLSFMFSPKKSDDNAYYMGLTLNLSSSENVDRHGFLESLPQLAGMGGVYVHTNKNGNSWRTWTVTKGSDLEKILPRLIKHMVIKGKHWQWLLETRREQKGVLFTKEEREPFKVASKKSRFENTGPVKPKKHPTWAWVAGYLDGDGHYSLARRNGKSPNINVGAVAHENDIVALQFLQHAFGGYIYPHHGAPHVKRWRRNLGPRDASFATRFLSKVANHSRLKRHKIDQILHYHSQRLSV
jgi:hypothetical protein